MEWWYIFPLALIAFTVYQVLTDSELLLRVVFIGVLLVVVLAVNECSSGPSIIPNPPRHR